MFSKILVAVDLSEAGAAQRPLAVATELAKASGASLRLAFVRLEIDLGYDFAPPVAPDDGKPQIVNELSALAKTVDLPADRLSVATPVGTIHDGIIAAAADFGADLIVIGPHRPSMAKLILGSNATRIVRDAKTSVLIAR